MSGHLGKIHATQLTTFEDQRQRIIIECRDVTPQMIYDYKHD